MAIVKIKLGSKVIYIKPRSENVSSKNVVKCRAVEVQCDKISQGEVNKFVRDDAVIRIQICVLNFLNRKRCSRRDDAATTIKRAYIRHLLNRKRFLERLVNTRFVQ